MKASVAIFSFAVWKDGAHNFAHPEKASTGG